MIDEAKIVLQSARKRERDGFFFLGLKQALNCSTIYNKDVVWESVNSKDYLADKQAKEKKCEN